MDSEMVDEMGRDWAWTPSHEEAADHNDYGSVSSVKTNPAQAGERACYRNQSRAAIRAMHQAFKQHPLIKTQWPSDLPERCPLDPGNDRFFAQEQHNSRTAEGLMRCGVCGKTFVSQFYLDRHMDNKHAHELEPGSACMGHLCDFLPCQYFHPLDHYTHAHTRTDAHTSVQKDGLDTVCVEGLKECRRAVDRCFPPTDSPRTEATNAILQQQICNPDFCDSSRHALTSRRGGIPRAAHRVFKYRGRVPKAFLQQQSWPKHTGAALVVLAVVGIVIGLLVRRATTRRRPKHTLFQRTRTHAHGDTHSPSNHHTHSHHTTQAPPFSYAQVRSLFARVYGALCVVFVSVWRVRMCVYTYLFAESQMLPPYHQLGVWFHVRRWVRSVTKLRGTGGGKRRS